MPSWLWFYYPSNFSFSLSQQPDYGDINPEASAQIDRPDDSTGPETLEEEYPDTEPPENETWTPSWPPHVCLAPGTHNVHSKHSVKSLCYAFDSHRKNGSIKVAGISGTEDRDGKCHYPLLCKFKHDPVVWDWMTGTNLLFELTYGFHCVQIGLKSHKTMSTWSTVHL